MLSLILDKVLRFLFLIAPFIISQRFIDPVLLIKKTAALALFAIIGAILMLLRTAVNNLVRAQLHSIYVFAGFLIYAAIAAHFKAFNPNESLWGIIYLAGWLCVYILFLLYSNEALLVALIKITSIVDGIVSALFIFNLYDLLPFGLSIWMKDGFTFANRNFLASYLCFVIHSPMAGRAPAVAEVGRSFKYSFSAITAIPTGNRIHLDLAV